MDSRRSVFSTIEWNANTNAGLWLDKFLNLNVCEAEEKPEKRLIQDVSNTKEPEIYGKFFLRWQSYLIGMDAVMDEGHVQGRLAINLGAESVLETNIALHRIYGVPFIPGSALKGLAAFYVKKYLDEKDWGKKSAAYLTLFGNDENAGYVTFHDALYVPHSGKDGQALWPDIITSHHQKYYSGGANDTPTEWEKPIPVNFLTATGRYLIALSGDKSWAKAGFEVLRMALEQMGIGAKTSSGYGRILFRDSKNNELGTHEPYEIALHRLLRLETPSQDCQRGRVANIRDGGTYGFINPGRGGGGQVFVHSKNIISGEQVLRVGQVLDYIIVDTPDGKKQADQVKILLNPPGAAKNQA
jgi:CRISPR-associated protein Cmr6